VQHAPDLSTVCDALSVLQTEAKASTENAARMLDVVKHELKTELKNTTDTVHAIAASVQVNTRVGEDTKTAAKEAVEVGKANLQMARQIKNAGSQAGGAASYAAMAARGATLAGTANTQVPRMPPMQTQREVVVNIRDPITVLNLRAMNPCNLNAHVERAIRQSGNENISSIKVLSSNQLKSGDLSIKTATINETEALKQFADDWVHRVGNRASIRIKTYGIIAHSIRTSTMDMERFEEMRDQLLLDNKPFIPQAEIKYIGWLTRNAPTKSTEHALHTVTAKIYDRWNQGTSGQVASLLLLDVSGAFDNVSHKRQLHNLWKRKVDEKTVRWIASFLSDRHTHIMVDGFQSEPYAINTGIPQGSPLSPILYLFYNADLIEQCNEATDAMSTGYIDDVAILAWGDTTQRTCQILSTILEKAQQWASTHASVFAPDKFQLTHFTRTREYMCGPNFLYCGR
jgi:hypothetical protein